MIISFEQRIFFLRELKQNFSVGISSRNIDGDLRSRIEKLYEIMPEIMQLLKEYIYQKQKNTVKGLATFYKVNHAKQQLLKQIELEEHIILATA